MARVTGHTHGTRRNSHHSVRTIRKRSTDATKPPTLLPTRRRRTLKQVNTDHSASLRVNTIRRCLTRLGVSQTTTPGFVTCITTRNISHKLDEHSCPHRILFRDTQNGDFVPCQKSCTTRLCCSDQRLSSPVVSTRLRRPSPPRPGPGAGARRCGIAGGRSRSCHSSASGSPSCWQVSAVPGSAATAPVPSTQATSGRGSWMARPWLTTSSASAGTP